MTQGLGGKAVLRRCTLSAPLRRMLRAPRQRPVVSAAGGRAQQAHDDPGAWARAVEWCGVRSNAQPRWPNSYALRARRYGTQGGGWGRDAGQVVFDERSRFNGRVSVTQHPAGDGLQWRVLRFGADTRQSIALCAPAGDQVAARSDVLAQEYLKAIAAQALGHLRLRAPSQPPRLLCLGGGGGSLPLFLAALVPQACVDLVEIDSVVVAAARHCGFDAAAAALGNVRVHVAAAQDFFAAEARPVYDVVVVDSFDDADGVPAALLEPPFLAQLRTHVREDGGAVLMNTHGGQMPPLRVDEALAEASRRLRGLGEDTTTRRYRGYDGNSVEGRRVVAAASALAEALDAPCCATRVEEQGNVVLSVVVVGGGRPDSKALHEAALDAGVPAAWGRHVSAGLHVCGDVS